MLFGDRPPLTPGERRLVLRIIAVTAMPLAILVLAVTAIVVGYGYYELQDKTDANRQAIRESRSAIMQTRALARRLDWRIYDECAENENQDTVLVAQLQGAIRRARLAPPSPTRTQIIEDLQAGIDAREPPDEKPCPVPATPRPEETQP